MPQRRDLKIPSTDRFFIFEKALSRFRRWAAPARDFDNLERVRQSLTNQVNLVTTLDAATGCCSLAVDLHMPSCHGGSRQASGLEKAAIKQPSINA
ncbi:MAG: hypothetical protein OEM76_06755 [Gammaproteobacteria bacterium]|nr:hypothetical protein [Gammaproteobacteria bacterium]